MSDPELHASVAERLARLAPDQRGAATAPPGPILCVAPAGSGKTTTLVARICWLVAGGVEPGNITAVTFNRRAAVELGKRLTTALAALDRSDEPPRVRTFHALGREILADAGVPVDELVDRADVLRQIAGAPLPAVALRRLDDAFSRLKLDLRLDAAAVDGITESSTRSDRRVTPQPVPGDVAAAFVAYESWLREHGAVDFDDLVRRALDVLHADRGLLHRWRERCAHLLVDEVQDVDRSQLDLAVLLAGEERRIFLVGDDDQTIYAWRLADVRRVISLASRLPGLRRVDLTVNYRCPAPVVERAVRLVAHNRERFEKRISARPAATGELRLAALPTDDATRARRILGRWLDEGLPAEGTPATGAVPRPEARAAARAGPPGELWAVLARTNAELAPFAAVALELAIAFSAQEHGLHLEDPRLDVLLDAAISSAGTDTDPLIALGPMRSRHLVGLAAGSSGPSANRLIASLLAWAAQYPTLAQLRDALAEARTRLRALHRDDAALVLATVHGTKGLEFDHVAVVGMDEGRFPSRRSLEEADDPTRVLEEERRLAYVAWTRAKRDLVLVYDPGAPSPFLREAFSEAELHAD
jgi:DNA helicase-2/ATP-dependent DNA helicase PcrA